MNYYVSSANMDMITQIKKTNRFVIFSVASWINKPIKGHMKDKRKLHVSDPASRDPPAADVAPLKEVQELPALFMFISDLFMSSLNSDLCVNVAVYLLAFLYHCIEAGWSYDGNTKLHVLIKISCFIQTGELMT